MARNHPSLIFYFIINIVIFTSCAKRIVAFDGHFENVKVRPLSEKETSNDDGNLWSSAINFHQNFPLLSRHKLRRDSSSYSNVRDNEQATNNHDDDDDDDIVRTDSMLDDANIRYILDHMQTRDVNGQTALTKPADTFNGKLIPCFIH